MAEEVYTTDSKAFGESGDILAGWRSDVAGTREEAQTLLCLEWTSVCLFFAACAWSVHMLARIVRSTSQPAMPTSTGVRMRRLLAVGLLVANGVRGFSMLAEVEFQEGNLESLFDSLGALKTEWLWDLISLVPCVVFLSAFSIMLLFWAQLHYTATIVPLPLLDCLFVCVNIASYLLVAAVAVCTFLLRAYSHLWTYLTCIIGFFNAVLAALLVYYGIMVVHELGETARKKQPEKWLTLKVGLISALCPLAFLLRSGFFLYWSLSNLKPSLLLSTLLCLVSEWLPSVVALLALVPSNAPRSPTETLDDSTDSEVPLLGDTSLTPSRTPAGAPGATWKQLYPPPSA
eukprot:TRINITY_DN93400_c0_g1_i1.p1 TRINITY_DN93400_c0_g1~~TRINITY_DN93400_c0_g1_i1.p1  ORF type:complete len:345 (+),score=58.84 TRINITY_DN93400_c0_g1_i1:26-1060(+)